MIKYCLNNTNSFRRSNEPIAAKNLERNILHLKDMRREERNSYIIEFDDETYAIESGKEEYVS